MNLNFAQCEFGQEEIDAVNRVLSGTWLASGPENEAFEAEFAEYIGRKYAIAVNSGSSANLLALASLGLDKGSKVLTASCGFPATLSPILHLGLDPVLVDYDLKTHNVDLNQAASHRSDSTSGRCKAAIFAHSLGNPFDITFVAMTFGMPTIEDCCEAIGSKLNGRQVGSFGTLGTFSFYPAHQMTCEGTGGMIVTDDEDLAKLCRSMRDWGKVWDWDTKLGDNKTVYNSKIDDIDYYKHYTYETLGFNSKMSETAAAFGRVQLKKLDRIREQRIDNYDYLNSRMSNIDEFIHVMALPKAEPSWFGYPLTLRGDKLSRKSLGDWLEQKGIRTRPFFAGNITRHRPFRHLYVEGQFPVADKMMRDSLFIGIGQWLGKEELDYIYDQVVEWTVLQ